MSCYDYNHLSVTKRICGVMTSTLALIAVGGFKPWSGQTIENQIDIYCFSCKYATLRSRSKY